MKPFYIVVNPVGSQFAKVLQTSIQSKVGRKILRTGRSSLGHLGREFIVTTQVLNKIQQLTKFKENEVPCPSFTTDIQLLNSLRTKTVFARLLINSTGGKGIVEFNLENDVPPQAPLYTAYIPKKAEYRFHVFGNQVVDVQQKKKKSGSESEINTHVRNLTHGYVYCRDNINPPEQAANIAIKAVESLGYNYGAVDLIYNEKQDKCYVLEVNSRPGLMGITLDKYSTAIINQFRI